MATNYKDISTYRMEKNPQQVMHDTLLLLDQGVPVAEIDDALMRSVWIENGYQMLRRLAIREQEKAEAAKWKYKA